MKKDKHAAERLNENIFTESQSVAMEAAGCTYRCQGSLGTQGNLQQALAEEVDRSDVCAGV